jgi:hypothetical protein
MSADRGWIGDPQPSVEWRDSHYSRQADREFGFYPASVKPEDIERTNVPPLQVAARYAGGRPRRR